MIERMDDLKHKDFYVDNNLIRSEAISDNSSNITQTLDTKKIHNHMKFGQSNNNYALVRNALVRNTTTYNFHVIPEIDIVSVTKINNKVNSNGMDILPYVEESHTMTVEDAREFYIELTEKGYEEV